MQKAHKDVLAFHKKYGCAISKDPKVVDNETYTLRKTLINEEIDELLFAMAVEDLGLIADGIADSIYVLIGTAISYGIPLPSVWDAVHANNMKKPINKRSDGKVEKTEAFKANDNLRSDINSMLGIE